MIKIIYTVLIIKNFASEAEAIASTILAQEADGWEFSGTFSPIELRGTGLIFRKGGV